MGTSEDTTEILVHITAPSTAADDARYRALALAYLQFEPKTTVNLPEGPSSKPSAVPPDVLISPQASFGSVWDNVGSPHLVARNQQLASLSNVQPSIPPASSQIRDNSQPSWVPPPSEVPDSMPDNDISVPAFSTPTRVLGYYLQSTEHLSISSAGSVVQAPEGGRDATHDDLTRAAASESLLGGGAGHNSRSSAHERDRPTCQAPDSLEAVGDVNDTTKDHGADEMHSNIDAARETEDYGISISDLLPADRSASLSKINDWTHETQLISTEPAVATHRLGPRAPQHLERLAATMNIKGRYQPKYQARDMLPFDRGYWLMKLDGWEFEKKVATWGFLGNYIRREGRAGWGTRACRDESWDWIRLYGWEHIAGELYMLLYVASYRKLKYMEMTFYGAAGNVLIVVGPRGTASNLA